MADNTITPGHVSGLIDFLLKTKDPAVVGLRRILKKKADEGSGFPLKEHVWEELKHGDSASGAIFTDAEIKIMELEKNVLELRAAMDSRQKEAAKAVREAYAKGQHDGFLKGDTSAREKERQRYEQQLAALQEKCAGTIRDVAESRKELLNQAQKNLLELASLIARKIIHTEISVNPDCILAVIKNALNYIVDRQALCIRVSPDDLETVKGKKAFWDSLAERLDDVTVEPDCRIERGGCIIESNTGVADARIDVMYQELLAVIDSAWENMALRKPPASLPGTDEPHDESGA